MKKIYCFPNSFGFVGFTLFLVILLAGGTYQNNLVFMMAFLVLSVGLIAILQTARNIRDIEIVNVHIEPNFAGENTTAWVTVKNTSTTLKLDLDIQLENPKVKALGRIQQLEPQATTHLRLDFKMPLQRGQHTISRVRIKTSYPYSLFVAWAFVKNKYVYIVYPQRRGQAQLPTSTLVSGEDFSGHKNYVAGDNMSRIDWKIYSRRENLMVKEFKDDVQKSLIFILQNTPGEDTETRLSQLALWTELAEKNSIEYQLILPKHTSSFGHGKLHFTSCLERLALYQ